VEKDYKRWHAEKTRINNTEGKALFHEREVWWCALGENIGYEQDGGKELFTRPVVILTKFNLDVCLVIPLTARPKKGKYYFPVGKVGSRDAVAVLSQIRLIDRKRLELKITTLPESVFNELTRKVVGACFPNLKP
jgi:mRNA interferase MazF